MNLNPSRDDEFRQIAEDVLSTYDEMKYHQPTLSAESFYNNIGIAIGKNTGSGPAVVRTIPPDFISDVEITARKFLSPSEQDYFLLMYKQRDLDAQQTWRDATSPHLVAKRSLIFLKLGRAFEERGLFPTKAYFRPRGIK